MITNFVYPPKRGDSILLICLKCKKQFIGPNPKGLLLFSNLFDSRKNAKCPECGSKKVAPHPGIQY